MDTDVLGDFGRDLELRHLHRFVGSGDGEVNEAPHLLYFFFLDELEGVEVAHFGGDLAGKGGGVESGNAVDTALAGEQGLPDCAGGIAHGADQADAGDDDPSFEVPWQITCPPWRACRCSRQHRSRCESSPRLRPGFRYRRPLRRPSRVRRYRANRRPGRPRMTRWG